MKPEEEQRLMFNINAPSGVGKSVLAAKLLKVWQLLNPKGKIFIFAPSEDKAFKGLKVKYLTEEIFAGDEINVTEFRNPDGHRTMIVFDDMGNVADEIKKNFYKFQRRLLEQSRKHKIDIIIIGHRASDANVTKYVLSEMTHFVVFNGYYDANTEYTLKKKLGMTNKIIKFMDNKKLFGRYVIISKFMKPLYLMGESYLTLNTQ
jgi:hypothetical protein